MAQRVPGPPCLQPRTSRFAFQVVLPDGLEKMGDITSLCKMIRRNATWRAHTLTPSHPLRPRARPNQHARHDRVPRGVSQGGAGAGAVQDTDLTAKERIAARRTRRGGGRAMARGERATARGERAPRAAGCGGVCSGAAGLGVVLATTPRGRGRRADRRAA